MGQTRSFGGVGSMSGLPRRRTWLKGAQHLILCRSLPPGRGMRPGELHQNRQRDGHNGGNRRDAQSRLWASGNGALLPVRRLWTQPPQPPNHRGNIDREREQNHGRNDQNGGSIGAVKPTSNSSTSSRSPSTTN